MSFPHTGCIKRTDQSFRNREQKEHHKERSVIENISGIDMIADFPTSDPLHLLHLGVMKKCLLRWVEGTKSYKGKLRTREFNQINTTLLRLNSEKPTEIHRNIRELSVLRFWKGTEYRTFLLYLGIVALKDILPIGEYNHFLQLSCAAILCSSDVYKHVIHNTELLDSLLADYIEGYIELYGEQTISSNIHNLCHIKDDILRFGNLDSISTYAFENALGMMKLKLRAMAKPLEQLSRRMSEISILIDSTSDSASNETIELKYPLRSDKSKFQAVFFKDYRLSSQKFGDKWFMDMDKRIIEFKYATTTNGLVLLHGIEIKHKKDFFTKPLSSSKLNIYSAKQECNEERVEVTSKVENIKCKLVCTSYNLEYVFHPLLHTLH